LGILYFVQVNSFIKQPNLQKGLPLGFFKDSAVLILSEKGASFSQLSKFTLVRYPYALKFIFAPFVDAVNIDSVFSLSSF